jgi:hypothetical protein
MSAPQKSLATLLSLLLVATLWGLWSTGQEPAAAAARCRPRRASRYAPRSVAWRSAVRYVTRASERFALRAKLYQSAVQLLADAPKS